MRCFLGRNDEGRVDFLVMQKPFINPFHRIILLNL
jgi:hypothetical protein